MESALLLRLINPTPHCPLILLLVFCPTATTLELVSLRLRLLLAVSLWSVCHTGASSDLQSLITSVILKLPLSIYIMLLVVLTHLFHSFLGNYPFLPSFLYRFLSTYISRKKGCPVLAPEKSRKLGSECSEVG